MVTLPHHCEFLSDAWLAEAEQFLQRDLSVRKGKLGGRAFSVSERFTNAPPHLNLPNDVASWRFGMTAATWPSRATSMNAPTSSSKATTRPR